MCLIVVGWQAHPDYPLVVAANRDEFYARPTADAAPWFDAPDIFGGIDLEAGGTWLGIRRDGRFAAVTNVREPGMGKGERSRGLLARDFLLGGAAALDYAAGVDDQLYAGFNLLLSDGGQLVYCSNRDAAPRLLPPGIYGLSNDRLDSPWPKLLTARQRFAAALAALPGDAALFSLLADDEIAPDADLPSTGVPLEWERLLSAIFVKSENYGTRASTIAWQRRDGEVHLRERRFGPWDQTLQSSLISTAV
ncbi:MAG: NRDE family protein [Betaproteobacteria bacterium]|nr:NRDE family protein [Betaproteobacteria bacterium]MCL2887549.1 NRDE family protein [Betaproteobacteria bacterium]